MKLTHRSLGVVLIAFTIIASLLIVPGTSFSAFIDLPSLVWIVGIVAGGLFVGFPVETVLKTFRAGFQRKHNASPQQTEEYVRVLDNAYQLAWGAGIVGSLFGLIIMLNNMSDLSEIGTGLSVALLMLLYAGIISEIMISGFQHSLISNFTSSPANASSPPNSRLQVPQRSMLGKVAAVTLLIFLQFSVLLSSLSTQNGNTLQSGWLKGRGLANRPVHRHPTTAKDGVWYSYISAEDNR